MNSASWSAGAGQGIGRCFAHTLGEAGAQVAIVDVNKSAAESTVAELEKKGIRAIAIEVRPFDLFSDCYRWAVDQPLLSIYVQPSRSLDS